MKSNIGQRTSINSIITNIKQIAQDTTINSLTSIDLTQPTQEQGSHQVPQENPSSTHVTPSETKTSNFGANNLAQKPPLEIAQITKDVNKAHAKVDEALRSMMAMKSKLETTTPTSGVTSNYRNQPFVEQRTPLPVNFTNVVNLLENQQKTVQPLPLASFTNQYTSHNNPSLGNLPRSFNSLTDLPKTPTASSFNNFDFNYAQSLTKKAPEGVSFNFPIPQGNRILDEQKHFQTPVNNYSSTSSINSLQSHNFNSNQDFMSNIQNHSRFPSKGFVNPPYSTINTNEPKFYGENIVVRPMTTTSVPSSSSISTLPPGHEHDRLNQIVMKIKMREGINLVGSNPSYQNLNQAESLRIGSYNSLSNLALTKDTPISRSNTAWEMTKPPLTPHSVNIPKCTTPLAYSRKKPEFVAPQPEIENCLAHSASKLKIPMPPSMQALLQPALEMKYNQNLSEKIEKGIPDEEHEESIETPVKEVLKPKRRHQSAKRQQNAQELGKSPVGMEEKNKYFRKMLNQLEQKEVVKKQRESVHIQLENDDDSLLEETGEDKIQTHKKTLRSRKSSYGQLEIDLSQSEEESIEEPNRYRRSTVSRKLITNFVKEDRMQKGGNSGSKRNIDADSYVKYSVKPVAPRNSHRRSLSRRKQSLVEKENPQRNEDERSFSREKIHTLGREKEMKYYQQKENSMKRSKAISNIKALGNNIRFMNSKIDSESPSGLKKVSRELENFMKSENKNHDIKQMQSQRPLKDPSLIRRYSEKEEKKNEFLSHTSNSKGVQKTEIIWSAKRLRKAAS